MERSDVWFIAVVAATLGFLAGMAWMDNGHSADKLVTYQTLITGFMAVAAAFITVNAMNRSDQEQRRRHAEQMAHVKEPERLVRRRAAKVYPHFFSYLAEIAENIGLLTREDRGPKHINKQLLKMASDFLILLHQSVHSETMRQARSFF
ncbi:hypothetical protein [Mesorhizobium sp. ISC11]|uniref:hypothetical protein n=1 Tax=Mesorhizobium sp. ISC11 TaxID=3076428 RepID=UPI00301CA495